MEIKIKHIKNIEKIKLKGKNVVLIGNGYPHKEMGDIIDNFDIVVRMNVPKINDDKKLIGSKTSILLTNTGPLLGDISEIKNIFYNFNYLKNSRVYVRAYGRPARITINKNFEMFGNNNDFYVISEKNNRYLRLNDLLNLLKKYKIEIPDDIDITNDEPTTGITAIIIAFINNIRPYIYGYSKDYNTDAYYSSLNRRTYYDPKNHNLKLERYIISFWISKGYLYELN